MRRAGIVLLLSSLVCLPVVALAPAGVAQAATVPSGFVDEPFASVPQPTAIEWLPDSRLVVLGKADGVYVLRGDGTARRALQLAGVCSEKERGYLGVAHDPAFLLNGYLYLYYTRLEPGAPNGCVNRVSRFTLVGDTIDPASEVVLLDRISSLGANHNGGDLDVGPDGFLYVSVGDAGADPRGDSPAITNDASQDLSLLNGKILRVTLDGRPAPGNPLTGPDTALCATRGNLPSTPTTPCAEIFAWGLRNPFRIAFDQDTGASRFFVNDVGQRTREEINVGTAGANYGFPIREGICPFETEPPCPPAPAAYTDPLVDYGRTVGAVITGGAFVPDGLWPSRYDGAYLFADAAARKMWVLGADGQVDFGAPFASDLGYVVDMAFGFEPDGRMALYYSLISGEVRRIVPTSGPSPAPSADLRIVPVTPFRAYDTGAGTGVAAGPVVNGSTRYVDLDPPPGARAAFVNVTVADTQGPGFVRVWAGRTARPPTSLVNVVGSDAAVANATIVELDASDGFVVESTATARVVVDVSAWLVETAGPATAGRFVAVAPDRLADTRVRAGRAVGIASTNPWDRQGDDFVITAAGSAGVPADGTAAAVVVSVGLLSGGGGSFAGAFPSGAAWAGTSNVNVTPGDVRANLVLVPLGANGAFAIRTINEPDVVVDVVGYVTSASAASATSGLYRPVEPERLVDTRTPVGFDLLDAGETSSVDVDAVLPGVTAPQAIVQNLTVTQTGGPGFVTTGPGPSVTSVTSAVNFTAPQQTAAVSAITNVDPSGVVSYRSLTTTHLVVDVVGVFTR